MGSRERAEESRQAIAKVSSWHHVLGVTLIATPEEITKAHRKLVILHHPDKGGDTNTFKKVQDAYELGLAKRQKNSAGGLVKQKAKFTPRKPKPDGGAVPLSAMFESASKPVQKKTRPKPVPDNATKARLKAAVQKWESAPTTMPDEIKLVTTEKLLKWIRAKSCVAIDVREANTGPPMVNAISLAFSQLTTEPEKYISQIVKLREEGKNIVFFCQEAGRFGACGMSGTLFLDIFGFDDVLVHRLDGGFLKWRQFVEGDPYLKAEEALRFAVDAQKASDGMLAVAQNELDKCEDAKLLWLDPLVAGTWADVEEAKDLHTKVGPALEEICLEECVISMFEHAATKDPKKRGRFDAMIFTEINARFADKLQTLRATFETCEKDADARMAAVEAAKADEIAARPDDDNGEMETEEEEEEAAEMDEVVELAAETPAGATEEVEVKCVNLDGNCKQVDTEVVVKEKQHLSEAKSMEVEAEIGSLTQAGG